MDRIPPDLTITMNDIVRAGFCARKTPQWFADHGLDFRHFHKHGIPATELAAKGDGLALKVIERALQDRPSTGSGQAHG
jgi:hypothetical protein